GTRGLLGLAEHTGSYHARPADGRRTVDEWTPPLRAAPAGNNVAYASPKAWPTTANYTKNARTGGAADHQPYWYRSQTTSTEALRPVTSQASAKLGKLLNLDRTVGLRLREAERQERATAKIEADLRLSSEVLRQTRGPTGRRKKKKQGRTDELGRDIKKLAEQGNKKEMKYFGRYQGRV
ncbi:unnamed protein product, partial [Heterosigma akashiwo]